ncbi:hypothetical protein [Jannaschia formosa]|nr:hypothetical protein [Jannaschia formosa]
MPNVSPVWIVAILALALAALGVERPRPMVADLDLPERAASD